MATSEALPQDEFGRTFIPRDMAETYQHIRELLERTKAEWEYDLAAQCWRKRQGLSDGE